MVEDAQLLDLLDTNTRVTRTNYRLGWPSRYLMAALLPADMHSPRDAVTISKSLVDQHTLIDVSTSIPRSRHEPAYLRPAPPHVRANVSLMAWCIQLPSNSSRSADPPLPEGKARITCFWSWNPKGTWAVGGAVPQHLPTVLVGLVNYIRDGSEKVPVLLSYGNDVSITGLHYDPGRVTLSANYAVVRSDDAKDGTKRQLEFGVSSTQGWDVQVLVKSQNGEESPSLSWTSFVGQSPPSISGSAPPKRLVLRLLHSQLQPGEELVRVKVTIEQTVASAEAAAQVKVNGIPVPVLPMTTTPLKELLGSSPGDSAMSLPTVDTASSLRTGSDDSTERQRLARNGRSSAVERGINSLIKRNYIYFTSLLQEPEQKWRPVAESKGVSVHQLDSIDRTLVVFRAEAVFVGVSLWDLFATITTPGARYWWDKTYDEALLLEDVNEVTDVWHFKSKASWPVSARDSIMVRSTYKSPTSVHIFGFSTEDESLFPVPPSIDPNVIRTQIDLQGWSIEALSPNTTQVTLLEQSHPGGWSNKSSIPQAMMTTLAGLGEFAIKHGAPPVATRLGGAKAVSSNYDLDKETYRFEYEPAATRRSFSSSTNTAFSPPGTPDLRGDGISTFSFDTSDSGRSIECGLRIDADTWANSVSVLVDPPPKNVSALKRHRLSPNCGGLWITVEHDAASLTDRTVTITVRRGPQSATGKVSLTVNGSKLKIDNEDMTQADVQQLKKQKRSRPSRSALDQPPALSPMRKRQSTASLRGAAQNGQPQGPPNGFKPFYAPFARLYNAAAESTRSIVPLAAPSPVPESGTSPVDAALTALRQICRINADRDGESTDPFGWQPVSDRDGLKVEKRIVSHVSDSIPVFRAGRIIEGFTAEEVSSAVSSFRKDDYFEKPVRLQSYGYGITTTMATAHTSFPFRDRLALVATVVARVGDSPPTSPSVASHSPLSTIYHASTSSFDPSTLGLDAAKYNPSQLSPVNVIIEGWILETIDPYSHEQYAIPSTRCMYVGAMDYSGNIPISVNNMLNAGLPRSLLNIENLLKTHGPPSRSRWPPMCVLVPETSARGPWGLEGTESYKVPVDQVNDGDDYVITVTVQPPTCRDRPHPSLRHADSRGSMGSTMRSQGVNLTEDVRRGRRDLIVAEIDVASDFIKGGCEIAIRAVSLPEAYYGTGTESNMLPLTFPGDKLSLPFRCTVISLQPSVLQAASLDPKTQTRHLLRITLPTSGYEAPVNDPLTGSTSPLPRPRWLLDLINDGAVVQVRLQGRKKEPPAYMFEGAELQIEDERKLMPTQQLKEPSKLRPPQLVPASSAVCTTKLDKPLAASKEYLPDKPLVTPAVVEEEEDAESESTKTPTNEPAEPEKKLEVDTKPIPSNGASEPEPKTAPPAPYSRYNFWRYGALRFSYSAPVSQDASPVKSAAPLPSEKASVATAVPGPSSASVATATATNGEQAERATRDRIPLTRQNVVSVPLPAVIILCVVCLLLGSLLRSLITESDFVIYSKPGTEPPAGEMWRELKRLGEWRIGWNRDLIVALAQRRQ